VLTLNDKWAQQSPRTMHLLNEEAQRWATQGDRTLVIKTEV